MSFDATDHQFGGYTVSLPVYEGPLDLLLNLIEHAELDITKVALAEVTDQYLEYIHNLQVIIADEISAFLVIAAKLLQIKSEVLLPRPLLQEFGEENVGESLVQQLRLYKRFKEVANILSQREEEGLRTYLRVAPPLKVESKLDMTYITLDNLLSAATEIFTKDIEKQALGTVITPPKITIREKIINITKILRETQHTTFRKIIIGTKTRLEIVVTFLALLELIKRYRVVTFQEALFSDISIKPLGDFNNDEEFDIEFE